MRFPVFITCMLALAPLTAQPPRPTLIKDVRVALNGGDFAKARQLLQDYKSNNSADSFWLEAQSWLGRAKLSAKEYAAALEYAAETRQLALKMLQGRGLDDDKNLPIALGASIEVHAQALNAQGQKSEAVAFLQEELARWRDTSMRTRIQKNLHLITLEGKPAPQLELKEWAGTHRTSQAQWKGRPVLLFFWAHWCGDCKKQSPVIGKLASEFGPKGLIVVGPTQHYGYVAGGEDAPRDKETAYIREIYEKFYAAIPSMAVPVSEENFKLWGASTTPTLALMDKSGTVRLYHPGSLSEEELRTWIARLL